MENDLKLINVLLVDDDQEDLDLTLEVLEMTKMKLKIDVAKDGVEAVEFLNKVQSNDKQKLPDLILLDLNMPRMNGHEVLQYIKGDARFKHIPVVILTTSKSETDIANSYAAGVSCFVSKPVGLKEFQTVVEAVNNFWFTVVKFPEK